MPTRRESDRAEVTIIGGGIVGLSLAWYLRKFGVERVTLVERGEPGRQSSGLPSAGIRRQFGTRLEIEMTLAGWRFYEEVFSSGSYAGTFDRAGYTFLAGPQQLGTLRRAWRLQQDIGLPVRWLSPAELADMLPFCDLRGVAGGTFCGEDGFVDPKAIVDWLLEQCRAQRVRVLKHTPVDAVTVSDGRIRAIHSGRTMLKTDIVVDAAGAWAGTIGRLAGISIPVEPSPRVKYVAEPTEAFPDNSPLIVDLSTGAYVRSHGGVVVVGVKPERRVVGFRVDAHPDLLAWMAERASIRFPGVRHTKPRGIIKGLYEVTPDCLPLAGPAAGMAGLYVVAGFNGHGIMHGPGVARAVAETIARGRSETLDLEPLRPDRFERHPAAASCNLL